MFLEGKSKDFNPQAEAKRRDARYDHSKQIEARKEKNTYMHLCIFSGILLIIFKI